MTVALKKLPALFGGEDVFEKAEELMPDEKIKRKLNELREIYRDACEICGNDGKITVDLGIVNKTDYYTGLIIKGYLQGHGAEIISGGRYDKLISEFGYDVPAVGFAININGVAKVIEKSGVLPAAPKADILVFCRTRLRGCRYKESSGIP